MRGYGFSLTEEHGTDRRVNRPFPTKAEIRGFLESERAAGRDVGRRDVARAFGLGPGERIHLKRVLREIEHDAEDAAAAGAPAIRAAPSHLPSVMLVDVTGRDRDGELLAVPAEWPDEAESPPRIQLVAPRRARHGARGCPEPGLGDRVLVRLHWRDDHYAAEPVKVLAKSRPAVIGLFRKDPRGGGRILPVDKKALGQELLVRPGDENGAGDGELVTVSVLARGLGLARARVKERLGSVNSEKAISLIAIHAHGIPHIFPPAVLAEAERLSPATLAGREDWRAIPLVTIDPADARDHDDAVSAAPDEDPNNPGGHVLHIAIADVAAFVTPGSALDREALERGNSVYFPDRVVPMLPERISNDLCSLKPDMDRAALGVRIVIAADGRKLRHSFHRVLIRSRAKLAYPEAQAAIDGAPSQVAAPVLETALKPLWAAYAALKRARDARQPLDLDLPERKLILDADGRVVRVTVPERLDAHRLIEEFMILANAAAAEALERAPSGLIYRVHDEPGIEKMRALGEVLASIGHKLPKAGALQPALFNRILAQVRGGPHETFVNEVVLRSQAQALYARDNTGHFGLNLRRYAHFTSPIRRYADLIVHRALITHFGLGSDGLNADTPARLLEEIATRISAAERRAMAAERETTDRLIAHFLADQVGATFSGRISGVTRAGLFVKLAETGADGFVPVSTLGADHYAHDEAHHALVGARTGETFRLGDTVEVKLVEAAPVAGALRFEIVSEGTRGQPLRSGRGRPIKRGRFARSPGKGQFRGRARQRDT